MLTERLLAVSFPLPCATLVCSRRRERYCEVSQGERPKYVRRS
jgi:hypothetical protein